MVAIKLGLDNLYRVSFWELVLEYHHIWTRWACEACKLDVQAPKAGHEKSLVPISVAALIIRRFWKMIHSPIIVWESPIIPSFEGLWDLL